MKIFKLKDAGIFFLLITLLATLGVIQGAKKAITIPNKTEVPKTISAQNTTNRDDVSEEYTVIRVTDGDTITVKNSKGNKTTVRLLGIDAPETVHSPRPQGCFADEATRALRARVLGQNIILITDPTQSTYDKYGRLLAYIFLDNKNINEWLIVSGYAHEYTYKGSKYKYQADFKQAQKTAKQTEAGLWNKEVCPTK